MRIGLEVGNTAILRFDTCISSIGVSVLLSPAADQIRNAYHQIRDRGVKMRLITDITKDNALHCKQIKEYFHEVRHLDGVKGNFLVTDTAYDATAQAEESQPPIYLIFSNVKVFVEQQHYVFDTLWNKAIPAKQRIREIEEGLKREFIETIQDPVEIINLVPKVISSATEEISVLFSSLNTVKRYYSLGVLDQLASKAEKEWNTLNVQILLNNDGNTTTNLPEIFHTSHLSKLSNVSIQQNRSTPLDTKITLIIVDKQISLVIELKEDTETDILDSLGLATYSNSQSTVLSYESIFETLWVKSELQDGSQK